VRDGERRGPGDFSKSKEGPCRTLSSNNARSFNELRAWKQTVFLRVLLVYGNACPTSEQSRRTTTSPGFKTLETL
jgi:hypothetical protein